MSSFGDQGDSLHCGDLVILQGIIGVVALVAAYAGYRIYTISLGLCGALTACSIVGAFGMAWYGGSNDFQELLLLGSNITATLGSNVTSTTNMTNLDEVSTEEQIKLGIIAFFCLVWGVMGAAICIKTQQKMNQILGFICGAVLGFAAVALVVFVASSQVPKPDEADHAYEGWQWYTILAAGVPTACLVGYATRNLIMYVLMGATAFLGSFVGVGLVGHALECAAATKVEPAILLGVAVLSTVAAFVVQIKMTPEARKSSESASGSGCEV